MTYKLPHTHSGPPIRATMIARNASGNETHLVLMDDMKLEPDQIIWILADGMIKAQLIVAGSRGKFIDIKRFYGDSPESYMKNDWVMIGPTKAEQERLDAKMSARYYPPDKNEIDEIKKQYPGITRAMAALIHCDRWVAKNVKP